MALLRRLARFLLFGNYYLAFCIAALSYETTFKNGFRIADVSYYVLVFLAVVVYYTHAYIVGSNTVDEVNPRSLWYHHNRKLVFATQIVYTFIIISLVIRYAILYASSFAGLSILSWLFLLVFPLTALLYYGSVFPKLFRFRMRNIAWLKPFIIGFVCTGSIVVYPLIFHSLQQQKPFHLSLANATYFVTNWLFTTAIAILFDIKDFTADHNYHLKTFVVTRGLRFTIFYILVPLSVAGIFSFLVFAFIRHFSVAQMLINIIPFLLLLYVSAFYRRRRNILYYLIVIDGLLLVKALFGIFTIAL